MKKLLLIPALLGTMAMAENYKYEISPMIGHNFAEGNLGLKDNGYTTGGLEFQINSNNSRLSPEVSLYIAPGAKYATGGSTNVVRAAFNAVYTYDKVNKLTPFVKVGAGLENFIGNEEGNQDRLFFDTGAGVKMNFTKNLALKLEAIYMLKPSSTHAGNADSNFMPLVGLTYSFGEQAPEKIVEEVQEEVIVVAVPVAVDSDGDGIVDADDKCPNTPAGTEVDTEGCKINLDTDNDGVLNSKDLCPNTMVDTKVNNDGCPAKLNLQINFDNNSAKITKTSNIMLDKYATFLTTYSNYSAKIVGYADNIGNAKYNQKLSQKRAEAVVKALEERGVNPSQLEAVGMGEANPVASNATEEGRDKNRRIEAELTRK